MSFLNTHDGRTTTVSQGTSPITSFQYVPNNGIVMVKGSYMKNGEKKLSKIVGTLADDQSLAEKYLKDPSSSRTSPRLGHRLRLVVRQAIRHPPGSEVFSAS